MIRTMLVDDEKYVRSSIRNRIDWDGLGLVMAGEAASGQEALAMINEVEPDIMIVDVRMPMMDGIELMDIVKKLKPTIQFIMLSGYSDFHYAQSALRLGAVNYLTKPVNIDEMTGALESAINRLETNEEAKAGKYSHLEQKLNQMLRPSISERQRKKFLFYHPNYIISALYSIRKFEEIIELVERHKQLAGLTVEVHVFRLDQCQEVFCILLNFDAFHRHAIDLFLNRLSKDMGWLVVHELRTDIHSLGGITAQVLRTLRGKLLQSQTGLLHIVEQTHGHSLLQKIGYWVDRIRVAIEQSNQRMAYDVLDMIFNTEIWRGHSVEALDVFLTELGNVLKQEVLENEMGTEWYEMIDELFYQGYVLKFDCLSELCRDIKKKVAAVMQYSGEGKGGGGINGIIGYIEKHYHEDLTLQTIARQFFFNPAYLSHFFKKKTNMNLFQYIEDIRIREAKALLHQSTFKVIDIAAQVGFKDSNYFSKVFARRVGITPSKYRKLLM